MARRVFFSFHFEKDIIRANQVRNSWVTKPSKQQAGYLDAAEWEKVKKGGETAVKKWIDNQLFGTSVTVVLIGSETSKRKYVKYEIEQSLKRNNALLGIYVHNVKDFSGKKAKKGDSPFKKYKVKVDGRYKSLASVANTYDWIYGSGFENLGAWIEDAIKRFGK